MPQPGPTPDPAATAIPVPPGNHITKIVIPTSKTASRASCTMEPELATRRQPLSAKNINAAAQADINYNI